MSTKEQPGLVPVGIEALVNPQKRQEIESLPHLQRLSALVYLFMQTKSRFTEQGDRWLEESHKRGVGLDDLLKTDEFKALWPISECQKGAELPKLLTRKIQEAGNPFGFSEEATRAALEMANEVASDQMQVDFINTAPYQKGPKYPETLDYFEETIFYMMWYGKHVGKGFSLTQFPAYQYWDELFPLEIRRQMAKLQEIRYHPKQEMRQ